MDELRTTAVAALAFVLWALFVMIFLPICAVVLMITAVFAAVKRPITENVLVNYFMHYVAKIAGLLKTAASGLEGLRDGVKELEEKYSRK